jgi:hypothetical protein
MGVDRQIVLPAVFLGERVCQAIATPAARGVDVGRFAGNVILREPASLTDLPSVSSSSRLG